MTKQIIPVPTTIKKDLTGQRFGRWTVIGYANIQERHSKWICRCDCGKQKIVAAHSLISGGSLSCGCLRNHGMSGTPEHKAWRAMIRRCNNPEDQSYKDYGERGIRVCDRWLYSFENFLEDMGNRPGAGYSIDRVNNDGNYQPDNCRWTTRKVQTNNRRCNHILSFEGKSLNITQWGEELGISRMAIWHRINQGWTVEDALTKPVIHRRPRKQQ